MKSPAYLKRILGKNVKPGDIIYWFTCGQMNIILSVEVREDEIYGWLLTQKLNIDWFSLAPDQDYEIISS